MISLVKLKIEDGLMEMDLTSYDLDPNFPRILVQNTYPGRYTLFLGSESVVLTESQIKDLKMAIDALNLDGFPETKPDASEIVEDIRDLIRQWSETTGR